MKNISFNIICIHHHEREGMKFEFPFQGLYEQIENVVSKIYFPLNVSFNARKCDPQSHITLLMSSISTLFVTCMIIGFNSIFLTLFVMMIVRINFTFFVYTWLYDRMINYDGWLIWSCNNIMFRVKRCLGCVTNRSKYLTDLPDVQISCPFFLNF